MTNKPILQTRDRGLSISVFKREKDGRDIYGACLQRSWKDKDSGEYKREQINLFPDELLKLSALCARAYTDTLIYVQANRPTTSEGQYPSQELNDEIPF